MGLNEIPFLSSKGWWIFTYIICNVWKEIGWGTIIYLAALTGVDEALYEAAYLDGATTFQRIIYITLPSVKSVIVTMLILQISKMMTIGLDAPLLLGNTKVMQFIFMKRKKQLRTLRTLQSVQGQIIENEDYEAAE